MAQNNSELFKYLNEQFTHIDQRFDEIKNDFSTLQNSVDAYAKKADSYFQEMLLLNRRMDRLEQWAKEVGAKIGVKLEY